MAIRMSCWNCVTSYSCPPWLNSITIRNIVLPPPVNCDMFWNTQSLFLLFSDKYFLEFESCNPVTWRSFIYHISQFVHFFLTGSIILSPQVLKGYEPHAVPLNICELSVSICVYPCIRVSASSVPIHAYSYSGHPCPILPCPPSPKHYPAAIRFPSRQI